MEWVPLGESAFLIRHLESDDPVDVALRLEESGLPGIIECVASYGSVGVYVDADTFQLKTPRTWLAQQRPTTLRSVGKRHLIPVCYELGEDLGEVASKLDLPPDQVCELHAQSIYRCYCVGFSPGFPYLGYLPECLCGVVRKPLPRTRVPSGSVAITGNQTAIYPSETPGGWSLIGRTPLCLVDLKDAYFPIRAGDEVQFVRIDAAVFDSRLGERL